VPTGWTRWNFTDCSGAFCATPGLDLNDLDSDSYKDFVVVSETTLQPLKSMAFNVRPGQFVNGVEVTTLISGNLVYAESDVRDGDQVQFLTTPAYDLSGFTKDAVLSFHNIYEQNQDSIGVVEYSIDNGTNWLPVAYYLDMLDSGGDIKLNPDGSVNAVKTLTDPNADTAAWIEGGVTKGDTYGAFVAAPITDALGPYIEPRRNDDNFDGQRVEVYYLAGAAKQSKVRLRFAQGGTGSWFFGIDNLGLYDVQVPRPAAVPPLFNAPALQGGNVGISWTGSGTLQQAIAMAGPWTNAPSQTNPQTIPATGPGMFYRLKQ